MNFHCKNRIPQCIWNQRHPRIDCFTSYQSYLRTNNLIILERKHEPNPWIIAVIPTNQPTNHPSRQVLQHRRCWRPGWSHPLSCHGKLGTSINEGQNGQIRSNPPIFMRLFKWKEHQKNGEIIPQFLCSFFLWKENPSMEVNPPMFMFMFFFVGKIPYQWRFIARWENPRDEIWWNLRRHTWRIDVFVPKKNVVFVGL